MKTHHPLIKSLIDFVDNPARRKIFTDDGWKIQNARDILAYLIVGWVAVIVYLIVRLWE